MNVTPVPFEPRRYFVQSSSRPQMQHLVDLDFDGEAACGCEDHMCRGKRCKHIDQARAFEQLHQTHEETKTTQ